MNTWKEAKMRDVGGVSHIRFARVEYFDASGVCTGRGQIVPEWEANKEVELFKGSYLERIGHKIKLVTYRLEVDRVYSYD